MDQFNAQYHLPGLFEFYALYRLFLPLFFEHREYFYDWCGIGSIYGAPEGCLWGGGPTRAAMRCAACLNQAEKTESLSIPTCWQSMCGSIIRGCTSFRPRQRS